MHHRNLLDARHQRGLLRYWLLRGGVLGAVAGSIAAIASNAPIEDWTAFVVLPGFGALIVCCVIVLVRAFVSDPSGVDLRHDW